MNDDELLEDLLDDWEESCEQGNAKSLDELCKSHPHLKIPLQRKIERLKKANVILKSSEETVVSSSPREPRGPIRASATFSDMVMLGRGGLGEVYQAKDGELNRFVAVKFLQKEHVSSQSACRQFEAEAEITSRLDHPGIIPIYGHGVTEAGQPFYVMRSVDGKTFRDVTLDFHAGISSRLTSPQQVELHQLLSQLVWVCRVINYAHSRGVIHRDVKPDNIIVGKHGETIVLDWGLAEAIGRDEFHQQSDEATLMISEKRKSSSGTQAGTPIYMSPEQYRGEEVGPATDIYALGVTLYFMLCGQTPFDSKQSLPSIRSHVIEGKITPPKNKSPWVPKALQAICQKAMAVDLNERYVTAADMARDIERFLADEPVQAFQEPTINRAIRWMRKHKSMTKIAGAVTLTLVIGLVALSVFASANAKKEREARIAATAARNRSLRLASEFAARTVGFRMNDRWRILESEVARDHLINLVTRANQQPDDIPWNELQGLILQIKDRHQAAAGKPDSWFLCDTTGRQIARAPVSAKSIGSSYSHRDYFHGNGRDLAKGQFGSPQHITTVHRSKAYVSSSTGKLKVALTVPIWSTVEVVPDRQFLGILGMSVSLGEFIELQTSLDSKQIAMVVDLERNAIGSTDREGLILHHPAIESKSQKSLTIGSGLIGELNTRRSTLRNANLDEANVLSSAILISDFHDPFSSVDQNFVAHASLVFVNGRPISVADTGWAVIVAEPIDD